jgi:hypothetical protein
VQTEKTRKGRYQPERVAKQSKAEIGTQIQRQGPLKPVMVTKENRKAAMPGSNQRE